MFALFPRERHDSASRPTGLHPAAHSDIVMLEEDAWYAALTRRDSSMDGLFFVAVRTTGIYCRPVCPARVPLRKNTCFFHTAVQAQEAGYRPCLRCRPESAPNSPAWIGSLASVNRGLRLIDEGARVQSLPERHQGSARLVASQASLGQPL